MKPLSLWHLWRPEEDVRYDECAEFVVRAGSESDARELAASQAADEGEEVWRRCQCELISLTDEMPGVLVRSFNAG